MNSRISRDKNGYIVSKIGNQDGRNRGRTDYEVHNINFQFVELKQELKNLIFTSLWMIINGYVDESALPLIDYDLTTTHGSDLLQFVLFCKKCSLREEKYDARKC